MTECGGKTNSGGKCKRPAGWGTDHAGEGKCKLHGGASLRGADHPNFKHGLYTPHTPKKIQAKVDTFLNADPFDLTHELALLRGLLSEFLSRFEFSNIDSGSILTMSSIVNDIRRLVDTIAKNQKRQRVNGC